MLGELQDRRIEVENFYDRAVDPWSLRDGRDKLQMPWDASWILQRTWIVLRGQGRSRTEACLREKVGTFHRPEWRTGVVAYAAETWGFVAGACDLWLIVVAAAESEA